MAVWSRPATEDHKQLAGLPGTSPALWHEQAAWIKPAALVRAWLSQPGIRWQGNVRVAKAAPCSAGWELRDDHDVPLATAELVVIAAANDSTTLLPRPLVLQPVRGQVSYGAQPTGAAFPLFPVNGSGHFLPGIPFAGGTVWVCGATYDRDDAQSSARAADHAANLSRLEVLLPSVAARLAPAFQAGEVSAWVGQRCASADRRPLVGEIAPGLWVSTAMGSRGLTFAGLCAELIAARLHGEPLPLPGKLARALDVQRHLAAVPAAAAYPD
jgi:tRNA 5-methylaminomethyl-2-thiouridine biosynthesis bifunctional protein